MKKIPKLQEKLCIVLIIKFRVFEHGAVAILNGFPFILLVSQISYYLHITEKIFEVLWQKEGLK